MDLTYFGKFSSLMVFNLQEAAPLSFCRAVIPVDRTKTTIMNGSDGEALTFQM